MQITKHGFSQVGKDNDILYLEFIVAALKHSDPDAEITLHKVDDQIKVNISPSIEDFRQQIIENILGAHRLLNLKVIFSKSLKIQKSISYHVDI